MTTNWKSPTMWLGLFAFLPAQGVSIALNAIYGWVNAPLLAAAFIALDLAAIYLVPQIPSYRNNKAAKLLATVWVTGLLLISWWTSFSFLNGVAMAQRINNASARLVEIERSVEIKESIRDQAIAASQAKPHLEDFYLKRAEARQTEIDSLLVEKREIREHTPSEYNAAYVKVAETWGMSTDRFEFVLLALLSFFVVTSGSVVWGFMSAASSATERAQRGAPKSATKPERPGPSGTSPGGPRGTKKTPAKLPKNVTYLGGKRALKRDILRALKSGELLRPSSRQVRSWFRVGDDQARDALREMADEGDLTYNEKSNRYALADKHREAAA